MLKNKNDHSTHIFINGRFLTQPLAGVQRYAAEMSRALTLLYPDRITVLAPKDASSANLGEQKVGKLTGQLWEQLELPWYARHGFLLNLGNTAPVMKRRQAIVIHDAGVFSTPEAYSLRFRIWYKALHLYLSRNGTTIITVSQFSKSELVRYLRISPCNIYIAGEGIDHIIITNPKPEILSKNGLQPKCYVLVVGTLAVHKNVAALNILSDRLKSEGSTLAVMGALGNQAFTSHGRALLPSSAKYLGRVEDDEMKALYQNAACFVFPSRYEGFGLPPLEAMACGCAVVASDIPALRETCGDGAIYCDSRSPSEIADVVFGLLNDPTTMKKIKNAAKKRSQLFTWDQAAIELSRLLPPLSSSFVS